MNKKKDNAEIFPFVYIIVKEIVANKIFIISFDLMLLLIKQDISYSTCVTNPTSKGMTHVKFPGA